jgi:hypothetical protein
VTVVPFPTPSADTADGETVAAAVDRYLDSVQTRTTRDSYAETLARLTALAGTQPIGALTPEDYSWPNGRTACPAGWSSMCSARTGSRPETSPTTCGSR